MSNLKVQVKMGHYPGHFQDKIKFQDTSRISRISRTSGHPVGALAIELNSSKAIAGKELSISSWCIASLYIYHFSTVVNFPSEKYSDSTGYRNSWY